jgi:hypothetical protein
METPMQVTGGSGPDGGWSVEALRRHVEQRFVDKDTSLRSSLAELERRLDLTEKSVALESNKLRLDLSETSKPQWSLLVSTAALLVTITAGLWLLAIEPIKVSISEAGVSLSAIRQSLYVIETKLAETITRQQISGTRIDKLESSLEQIYRDIARDGAANAAKQSEHRRLPQRR